jgi:hypothetical protein
MKLPYIVSVATSLALSGCAVSHNATTTVSEQSAYRRFETICYDWDGRRVEIAFRRQARDSAWTLTLRDAWDVYERSSSGEGKTWDQSSSRCSAEECVEMIDQGLTHFQAEKPNAELDSLEIEMQVVQEIWSEVLGGLRPTLTTIHQAKAVDRIDVPRQVYDKTQNVLDQSTTVAAIKRVLARHGMRVQHVYITGQIIFKDSLTGKKWSDIGNLPGLGILVPGSFELAVKGR